MKIVTITNENLGALCVCALRYCQGRQSYMPAYIQELCREYLSDFSDTDLNVMLRDCHNQADMNLYGTEHDKKNWLRWKEDLENEIRERG